MIVVNAENIRLFAIMVLLVVWIYLLNHPGDNNE
tara:strand:+ start:771 stop:872 length:102 start_codon:yes stop_codon:yes gene_type:complete